MMMTTVQIIIVIPDHIAPACTGGGRARVSEPRQCTAGCTHRGMGHPLKAVRGFCYSGRHAGRLVALSAGQAAVPPPPPPPKPPWCFPFTGYCKGSVVEGTLQSATPAGYSKRDLSLAPWLSCAYIQVMMPNDAIQSVNSENPIFETPPA